MKWLARLIKEDSGATAVEYGIMVAAIAAVIITVVFVVGNRVQSTFATVNAAIESGVTT
jgi:pilus assembly protein Flp/PilA